MKTEEFGRAVELADALLNGINKVIKGRDDTIKLVIAGLLADGHVLLEDYPGSGKTTLTKTLGRLIRSDDQTANKDYILPFRRIQFTPDMLPGDVLGVNIFEPQTGNFRFLHGPVFAHIVLADEINRTGPKVQSAFLECMAEKQVTIDNQTHPLDELFFVIGTQNPLDLAGTYPLPLVQLDRFLFKIPMTYVDKQNELSILEDHEGISERANTIESVCSRSEVLEARTSVRHVYISEAIREAIVDLVQSTRNNPILRFGVSTRAALMLQSAVKAWAIVNARDFVSEDDLKFVAPYVLRHRLIFNSHINSLDEELDKIIAPHLENLVSKK